MGLLDRAPLDLSHPDSGRLLTRLYQVYDRAGMIRPLALAAGIQPAFLMLERPATEIWSDLLIVASNQGLLRALVAAVRDDPNSAATDLRTLLTRLLDEPPEVTAVGMAGRPAGIAAAPVAELVFESALLWDDLPFIDRVDLRRKLKTMIGPAGRRALLVIGESGSGKSYTRQFIHFLTDHGGPRRVRPIDMSMRAGAPIDVRELASSIARTLVDRDPPTFDPTAQSETVVGLFKAWLVNAVDVIHEPTWLVFDGFTSTTATGGAIGLVQ